MQYRERGVQRVLKSRQPNSPNSVFFQVKGNNVGQINRKIFEGDKCVHREGLHEMVPIGKVRDPGGYRFQNTTASNGFRFIRSRAVLIMHAVRALFLGRQLHLAGQSAMLPDGSSPGGQQSKRSNARFKST
jgi:hypothetical protein